MVLDEVGEAVPVGVAARYEHAEAEGQPAWRGGEEVRVGGVDLREGEAQAGEAALCVGV